MANSYVEIPVTGVDSYAFPFPYLEQSHIKVYAGGVLQTQGVHYTFTDSNTIEFSVGNVPTDTTTVIFIQRVTTDTGRLVTYSNTGLDADDLNLGSNQNFYLAQEAIDASSLNITRGVDGTFSVDGRLTSVEDPIDAQDAATKAYVASQLTQSATGGVYIQATAPTGVTFGDLWVDTDTNVMSVYTPTGWATGGTVETTTYNFTGADLSTLGSFSIIPDYQVASANIYQLFVNGVLLKECTTALDFTTGDWDRSTSLIAFDSALAIDDEITINTSARMSQALAESIINVSSKMDTYLNIAASSPTGGLTLKQDVVATASQTVFNLTNDYIVGSNNISVYINGVRQSDYVETNVNTITFNNPLTVGDEVSFLINEFNASIIEQAIVNQAEDARDDAISAKEDAEQAVVDVTPIVNAVTFNPSGNTMTLKASASVRVEGGTSTNWLTALTTNGAEEDVLLWSDTVVQIQKPINLVSPNGSVAKQLSINNAGQLVFDGTVIS